MPLGRTWEGCDCWGLVRLFYKNEFEIELPGLNGYDSVKNHRAITGLVEDEKPKWTKAERPEFGQVIVFNMAGRPVHVAILIDKYLMLHTQTGKQSCLERYQSPRWKNRIEGTYRIRAGSYCRTGTPVT